MSERQRDYMAEVLQQLEHLQGEPARQLLEGAAEAHPEDARPLLLLAAEYMHAGHVDSAEAIYIAALQRAPDFAIARFQLGLLQFTSARPAAAQATWALLDALPETDPLRLFKTAFEHLGQNRYDEARRFLREGMAQNRTNPALNRDMQLVLDRMDERGLGTAGPSDPDEKDADAPEPSHVLVSRYRDAN